MPEVFSNFYTFASPAAVPTAEVFRDRLAASFNTSLELIKHERGDHGAPRAYACIRAVEMQFWIYWEPDRAEVELTVDELLMRMIQVNAAIAPLGGTARYNDDYWLGRRRYRTLRAIRKLVVFCIAVGIAISIIWYLHWWGVLIVLAIIAIIIVFYTILLSRAFGRR